MRLIYFMRGTTAVMRKHIAYHQVPDSFCPVINITKKLKLSKNILFFGLESCDFVIYTNSLRLYISMFLEELYYIYLFSINSIPIFHYK